MTTVQSKLCILLWIETFKLTEAECRNFKIKSPVPCIKKTTPIEKKYTF